MNRSVLSLLLASALTLSVNCFAASNNPDVAPDEETLKTYPGAEYIVTKRIEGQTGFISESDAPKKANKKYPAWFRGNGANGLADENALYWYTELIGPKAYNITKNMNAENLYCGTLRVKPGATYPAHNHPASEFYFIISGEAEWYINDEKKNVKAGDLMYHRPFNAHGWKNTSKTEPMKCFYCWWKEAGDKVDVMNYSAGWINPEKFTGPDQTVPHAIPLPKVESKK